MSGSPPRPAHAAGFMPQVFALIGFALYAWCFYPGAMSPDTAYAWSMARGSETNNVQGVGLVWLFRLTDPWLPGPAGPFLCIQALFWAGLALIASELPIRPAARVLVMLVAAAAPVCFVLLSHVWSDVALMAALSAAAGMLLRYRRQGHSAWLVGAVLLLWWALTLRHNALPAVVPLFAYAVYVWTMQQKILFSKARGWRAVTALALASALWLSSAALDRAVDHRVNALPSLALWDLTAISLKAGSVLLPADSHGPGLDLDDLRQAYTPYMNLSLFIGTRAGIGAPFLDPADPRNDEIRDAWLAAIRNNPGAYLAHRWRLTRALFGTRLLEWPHELVYVDGETAFGTNPPVAPNGTALHALIVRAFEAARATPVLAAWPYLLLALVAMLHAWRHRGSANAQAAFAVLSSGLLYAAPLPFIAPSAELRYLGWTCLAALIGAALAFTSRPATGPSVAYPPAP
ncbi:MAG TPA: hypothetical protein VFE67_06585 [Rudaea sp.]|jgi:hypothetical protein|nr:hypothetical protein [Rudaea sp.]